MNILFFYNNNELLTIHSQSLHSFQYMTFPTMTFRNRIQLKQFVVSEVGNSVGWLQKSRILQHRFRPLCKPQFHYLSWKYVKHTAKALLKKHIGPTYGKLCIAKNEIVPSLSCTLVNSPVIFVVFSWPNCYHLHPICLPTFSSVSNNTILVINCNWFTRNWVHWHAFRFFCQNFFYNGHLLRNIRRYAIRMGINDGMICSNVYVLLVFFHSIVFAVQRKSQICVCVRLHHAWVWKDNITHYTYCVIW